MKTLGAWCFALLAFFVCVAGFHTGGALAQVPVPAAGQRVTDLTGTLSVAELQSLAGKLAAFERAKGAQIAIVLIPTTTGESIEQFALRVAEAWKLGRATPPKSMGGAPSSALGGKVNDGLLIVVAKDDRRMRIEVGYGLEGAITDATAKRVISETILPKFKQNDFGGGLDSGVAQLLKLLEGETLPAPWSVQQNGSQGSPGSGEASDGFFENLPFMLFGLVFAVFFLPRLFGRRLGALVGGGGASALGYLGFGWPLALALGGGAMLFFIILVIGGALAGSSRRAVRRSGGWGGPIIVSGTGSGGWGGGWGGGGSSDDNSGFGGGGGDFGGGGASGDW